LDYKIHINIFNSLKIKVMKKFISAVGYLAAVVGILINVFLVPEPTNKQIVLTIFYAMVIVVLSIQKEEN